MVLWEKRKKYRLMFSIPKHKKYSLDIPFFLEENFALINDSSIRADPISAK
jgi:hypothetical protein